MSVLRNQSAPFDSDHRENVGDFRFTQERNHEICRALSSGSPSAAAPPGPRATEYTRVQRQAPLLPRSLRLRIGRSRSSAHPLAVLSFRLRYAEHFDTGGLAAFAPAATNHQDVAGLRGLHLLKTTAVYASLLSQRHGKTRPRPKKAPGAGVALSNRYGIEFDIGPPRIWEVGNEPICLDGRRRRLRRRGQSERHDRQPEPGDHARYRDRCEDAERRSAKAFQSGNGAPVTVIP